ncbi:MAG: hypothetical protein B6I34_01380 [Anaerolineaceae bacterium 4572_32.1]|nr:MAG: hypothetical protein B6I34_01380 [Anaerolineaceae bacterium 4572_32.1]
MFERIRARRLLWGLAVGLLALAVLVSLGRPALLGQVQVTQAQGEGVELTVYNQNMALVIDRRSMDLVAGLNEMQFTDVASQIDPTSVHFRSLTDPEGTVVLEQNYEYDLVSTSKLLAKYIDQEIVIVTEDGTAYMGTLLSGVGDIILQAPDGQITVVKLDTVKDFSFPALPQGLITRPTLVWLLEADEPGTHDTEVTYLTGGLNWRADYIVVLSDDDAKLDLTGWVTVDNRSGATYEEAKLKLVAGDIHRAEEMDRVVEKQVYAEAEAVAPSVEERTFFEYHLYEVQRPVTVKDNQTKQIEFSSTTGVPVEKFYVYDGAPARFYGRVVDDSGYGSVTDKKVAVLLKFVNGEEQGLGIALPKGTVRVYKKDTDGSELLIGEDSIDHTPKDEAIQLSLGNAFDVVGERVQDDFNRLGERSIEETFTITLRNHKEEDIEVRVVERLYRWSDWEIVRETEEHTKVDAQTIEWRLKVPADGEVSVTYTVRYRW